MQKYKLKVQPRESKKPNQLRREGKIPGTLYGPGVASKNIQVDAHEFSRLAPEAYSHVVDLESETDGRVGALIRNVQRRPRDHQVLNIEFYRVSADRKITVTIPLKFVGVSAAVQAGGQLIEDKVDAEIECLPQDIPDCIEVDLSRIEEIDSGLHYSDLSVPSAVKILNPLEEVVVRVVAPRAAAVLEEVAAPAEAAEAEAAPAGAGATTT